MKITVRTSYFEMFMIFFQTFLTYYGDRLNDLIVLVDDNSNSIDKYLDLHRSFQFRFGLVVVERGSAPRKNNIVNQNANLLMRALDYDEVVTFDDDIIFLNDGVLDLINSKTTPGSIFGQKAFIREENTKPALVSYFIGKRNIKLNENDFYFFIDENDYESMRAYEMNDAAKMMINYPDKIIFLDKFLDVKQRGHSLNCVQTKYYMHLSGITTNYNEFLEKTSKIKHI